MLISPLSSVAFLYALIAGIFSVVLFYLAIKTGKKAIGLFILAIVFLLAHFSGIEWFLWINDYNLFDLLIEPIVPLTSYFIAWIIAVVYLSEKYFKKRWIWVCFLLFCAVVFIIARFCMNCL